MIVFRYLHKEVITMMAVVTIIVLLVFLCNEFVHYLSQAADGLLAGGVVLQLLLLEVPVLLALLLPLGLYLGILLVHGRLHADNEMTILAASGVSRGQLLWATMKLAFVVAAIVAVLTLWFNPNIMAGRDHIFKHDGKAALLKTIIPGRFRAIPKQHAVFYVKGLSQKSHAADDIFMAREILVQHRGKKPPLNVKANAATWQMLVANKAYQQVLANGEDMLVLQNGYRYFGKPGSAKFRIIHFQKYFIHLPKRKIVTAHDSDAKSTWQLLHAKANDIRAESVLQWRISVPLSVLLLAFLAVPLARVNPRQGKFAKFVPAILIYIVYANLLFVARSWVKYDEIPAWIGMWWVHGTLLILAIIIWTLDSKLDFWKKQFKTRIASRRLVKNNK